MKKYLAFILAAVVCLGLTACQLDLTPKKELSDEEVVRTLAEAFQNGDYEGLTPYISDDNPLHTFFESMDPETGGEMAGAYKAIYDKIRSSITVTAEAVEGKEAWGTVSATVTAPDFTSAIHDAMMGDVEISAGDHVEGQVPMLLDYFAEEQTRTENKSTNSVTPWKTSRRYYVMPCGDRLVGLAAGSSSISVANDLVDQTYGALAGGAAPTAELIMDCRVAEMDEELAEMFRDELRDYYEFTDQDIKDMGPLLMVEGRAFTTIRVFCGAGLGFVVLGLLLLVRRWTKVSKACQQSEDIL